MKKHLIEFIADVLFCTALYLPGLLLLHYYYKIDDPFLVTGIIFLSGIVYSRTDIKVTK